MTHYRKTTDRFVVRRELGKERKVFSRYPTGKRNTTTVVLVVRDNHLKSKVERDELNPATVLSFIKVHSPVVCVHLEGISLRFVGLE